MHRANISNVVLLIDGNPARAESIAKVLTAIDIGPLHLERVRTLSEGIERLGSKEIWAVFLSLHLPDSEGITAFFKLMHAAAGIPILLLAKTSDEKIAVEALQHGAQDYLLEDHINFYSLARTLRIVAQRKVAEQAFEEKERARVTLNSIGDAVLSTDINGNVTYLNVMAEQMTGWDRKEAVGRQLSEVFQIIDGATRKALQNPMELAIQQDKPVNLPTNCILIRRDGRELPIEDCATPIHHLHGQIIGGVIVFHDVTAARAMLFQMSHLAQYDALTDLPNRVVLIDRLGQAISLARRNGSKLAVLFLDLDGFKHVNDSLGHAIGDKLLQSVGIRLKQCVRNSDTVSRQGGDEFVMLLPEITHPADVAISAQKILATLRLPHSIAEHELQVTASIGLSTYPEDGDDAETLIKNADAAMYHAKENGHDNYQFFERNMNVRAVQRQSLEGSLRHALERNEFVLHYQPKVNLKTGTITGAEALLRWTHPDRGPVPPLEFVPIAEDCGLIVPIGQWVMREACKQARAWLDARLQAIPVAVNISSMEFRSKDFVERVRSVLRDTGLEPRYLEIEMTESVLMQHVESTTSVLRALHAMGVRIAVDDFGTGYSSLSYLRRFPIDSLKLDQSFVQEITANADDAIIVSAVISMGKSLMHRVIAEGVETPEQLAFLHTHACDEGQGYYFSRPMLGGQFAKLLETGVLTTEANLRPICLIPSDSVVRPCEPN
jgi:diguanylate cyclase (GGDEF)-like protein/PAS domain S-box-containing protein